MGICKYCGAETEHNQNFCSVKHQKYYSRTTNMQKYLKSCGCPERYLKASFKAYKGKADLSPVKRITSGICYLHGGTGAGKTYIAVAYLAYMSDKTLLKGRFINSTRLFIELRQSISRGDEEVKLKEFTSNNILVIDDIGTEKLSDYTLQSWYYIINERYNNLLPTMLTSNLSLRILAETYGSIGDRIASRISSGLVVNIGDYDYRKVK